MLWDYFYRTAAWGHFAWVAMNYSTPICVVGECSVFLGTLQKRGLHFFNEEIKRLLAFFYMTRHPRCTFCCQCLVLRELFKFTTELPACSHTKFPSPPPHIHSSNSVQCATYTPLSLHEKPPCQVCLPARSFSEHLGGWACWLGRLKTTRKVDDENCRRSAKVARLAGLWAQCQTTKTPQWQQTHIQVF